LHLEQQRRALELIYDQPANNAYSPHQPHSKDRDGVCSRRPITASGALQTRDDLKVKSRMESHAEIETNARSERESQNEHAIAHPQPSHPASASASGHELQRATAIAAGSDAAHGTVWRPPTKEEEFNSRRRHMSLDEACHSSKRERALYGTRPLYAVVKYSAAFPRLYSLRITLAQVLFQLQVRDQQ
jgi:hypothetical protein